MGPDEATRFSDGRQGTLRRLLHVHLFHLFRSIDGGPSACRAPCWVLRQIKLSSGSKEEPTGVFNFG